jgi:hypothetical protein
MKLNTQIYVFHISKSLFLLNFLLCLLIVYVILIFLFFFLKILSHFIQSFLAHTIWSVFETSRSKATWYEMWVPLKLVNRSRNFFIGGLIIVIVIHVLLDLLNLILMRIIIFLWLSLCLNLKGFPHLTHFIYFLLQSAFFVFKLSLNDIAETCLIFSVLFLRLRCLLSWKKYYWLRYLTYLFSRLRYLSLKLVFQLFIVRV